MQTSKKSEVMSRTCKRDGRYSSGERESRLKGIKTDWGLPAPKNDAEKMT